MVTLINPWTHTETYVTDERLNEYLGAGFVLASNCVQHTESEELKEAPKKKTTTTKKTTKK